MDLCEECRKREQEISFVEVKGGKKTVRYLCAKCANKLAAAIPERPKGAPRGKKAQRQEEENLKCPNCGLTYREFMKTAKLGCEKCFDAFGERLNQLLKNLHASAQYTGKRYTHDDRKAMTLEKIRTLKAALKKAVEEEKFEEAARLRDEIKALEERLNEA